MVVVASRQSFTGAKVIPSSLSNATNYNHKGLIFYGFLPKTENRKPKTVLAEPPGQT
jgi:hypothetical protein